MTLAEFQEILIYVMQFAFLFGCLFALLLAFFGKRN